MKSKRGMYGVMVIFLAAALLISLFAAVPTAADPWPLPSRKWIFDPSTLSNEYLPNYDQVIMAPVIADITGPSDMPDGIPDIIFTTFESESLNKYSDGIIRVISGNGGSHHYSIMATEHRVRPTNSIAVADIDNDKLPEIIAIDDSNRLICFEGKNGTLKWVSSYKLYTGYYIYGGLTIADIDQDSVPEIIVGNHVFKNNGSLLWKAGTGTGHYLSCVADLDADGKPEVIAGNCAYTYKSGITSGTVLWSNTTLPDGFNAIADFDKDGHPEIVLVGWGKVYLLNGLTGATIWSVGIPGSDFDHAAGGPPCIADIDGDGVPEIGVAEINKYVVIEAWNKTLGWTGTIKWAVNIRDRSSGAASSSAFDFNQDGKDEIVYSDEYDLFIFDNDNTLPNHIRFCRNQCPSHTICEMPVIADVDNDMHAEIVVPLNNYARPGNTGIEVYGNPNWPCTRGIWNQHTYHITNINDDATVPQTETNNWEIYNNYRVQPHVLPLDHFKCYEIEEIGPYKGGQSLGEIVDLQDQFGTINDWTVQDPKFFCNPVAKNKCGEVVPPILHHDHHLTVYDISYEEEPQTWRGQVLPKISLPKTWQVTVDNQFGTQDLTVSGPVALAVPSGKADPPCGPGFTPPPHPWVLTTSCSTRPQVRT